MVVKEVNPATEVAPSVQPVVVGPSAIDLNSRTEEQAFAFMSKGNWWIKQRAMLNQIKLSPKSRACKNRSSPIAPQIRATTRAPPIHVFAIEFDVSKSRRKGGGSSSNVASNNNNNNNAKGSDGSNGGSDGPPVAAPAAASASDKPAADGNANAVNELATTTTTTTTTTTPSPSESAPDVTGSCAEAPLLSWNKENRNDLLGAFFLGYVIFQVPAGRAAELLGPKLLLLCLGFGTGLSSLMFPYAARYSPDSIVFPYAIRVAMGASQAALFPASYVLLCNWLPKNERASWLAVPSSMGRFGTIAMNLVVPIIMLNYNWEWVFYTSGLVTIAWAILMVIFSSDRPSTSWWLSRDELIYIESRMEQPSGSTAANHPGGLASLPTNYDVGSTLSLDGKRPMVVSKPAIDWLKMLRNRALLILTVVMFSSEWSNMLLLVKLPGFLGPALKMPLEVVGYWSSALVLIYCVMYPLAGVLAARLEARLDSLRVRKIFEAMAHLFQASGCLMIAIFDHKAVVLSALVVMMIGRSLVGGGQCQMPPELSKDYPGTVLAVSNALANCAGIVGPMLLNFLVVDPTNYADWRSMWLFSAGVFIVCGILFCCLGDNRPQNYCKRPKLKKSHTTSLANLVLPAYVPPPLELPMDSQQQQSITKRRPPLAPSAPATTDSNLASDEIIRMGSFSRISSEPQPSRGQRRQRQQQQQQQQKQQKQEHKADD